LDTATYFIKGVAFSSRILTDSQPLSSFKILADKKLKAKSMYTKNKVLSQNNISNIFSKNCSSNKFFLKSFNNSSPRFLSHHFSISLYLKFKGCQKGGGRAFLTEHVAIIPQ